MIAALWVSMSMAQVFCIFETDFLSFFFRMNGTRLQRFDELFRLCSSMRNKKAQREGEGKGRKIEILRRHLTQNSNGLIHKYDSHSGSELRGRWLMGGTTQLNFEGHS